VVGRLGHAAGARRGQVGQPRDFSEPGTYVLRCLAHDGGLMAYEDVTIVVSR
jgi:hypothetical protein